MTDHEFAIGDRVILRCEWEEGDEPETMYHYLREGTIGKVIALNDEAHGFLTPRVQIEVGEAPYIYDYWIPISYLEKVE